MKQNENDQNHKKDSMPIVENKPNGKSQFTCNYELEPILKVSVTYAWKNCPKVTVKTELSKYMFLRALIRRSNFY